MGEMDGVWVGNPGGVGVLVAQVKSQPQVQNPDSARFVRHYFVVPDSLTEKRQRRQPNEIFTHIFITGNDQNWRNYIVSNASYANLRLHS